MVSSNGKLVFFMMIAFPASLMHQETTLGLNSETTIKKLELADFYCQCQQIKLFCIFSDISTLQSIVIPSFNVA